MIIIIIIIIIIEEIRLDANHLETKFAIIFPSSRDEET
jgi:hypothetical protein